MSQLRVAGPVNHASHPLFTDAVSEFSTRHSPSRFGSVANMEVDFTKLTRRPDPHRKDSWLIFAGDIRAGSIARAAGLPNATVAWKWSAGFYPGSGPGEIKHGTADTFEEARVAFEKAWHVFASTRTESDYQEWRDQQEWTRRKYAARDNNQPVPRR